MAARGTDSVAIAKAAQDLAEHADLLITRFSRHDFDAAAARAMVKALAAQVGFIADSGISSAEQATMAIDSLGAACAADASGFQAAIAKLYDYLEHPSAYRPAEFAEQFRKTASLLN